MVRAEILADSLHPSKVSRLTTFKLRFPRRVLTHLLTHKLLSKNTASFRATPISVMVAAVLADPAYPEHYGAAQKGMQASKEVVAWRRRIFRSMWWVLSRIMAYAALLGGKLGLHKQVVNYLLEPFAHVDVVVTGTNQAWSNFFTLRHHPDAHPTIQLLAEAAEDLYLRSTPFELDIGQWHLPYDCGEGRMDLRLKRSVAACARTSVMYMNRQSTELDDLRLYGELVEAQPMHASPAEHQACAIASNTPEQAGNFYIHGDVGQGRLGWMQYRKSLLGEAVFDRNGGLKG